MRRGLLKMVKRSTSHESSGKKLRRGIHYRRLRGEVLEDRRMLSVFVVTGNGDDHLAPGSMYSSPVPGQPDTYALPSLRAAVEAADLIPGDDTIQFDSSLAGQTITLVNGSLQFTRTTDKTTITGLGADQLTIDANNASRVFVIWSPAGIEISGLTISRGYASDWGGGIENIGARLLTVSNCTFSGNSANQGSAITNWSGALAITNSIFSANSADGVFIANGSTATIATSTFSGNFQGILNGGSVTVTNSVFSGNSCGIGNAGTGTITITSSTFSENVSDGNGGGIENVGTATVTSSTFSRNSAQRGGGGIYNGGSLAVTNSVFAGNSAHSQDPAITGVGGGINNYGGTATVTNSTFSGNSADDAASIFNLGTVTIADSTFSGNSADHGDGIFNYGTATLNNTLVAGTTGENSPADVTGSFTANHSLIQNPGSATITGTGNIFGQDPLLGLLGDYGGPTQTIPLLPGSPAIDAGDNSLIPSGVTTDQRGFSRIVNGTVDIGAYEFGSQVVPTLPAPTLSSPADGAPGVSTTPTFSWSAVDGASSYRIIVATNEADLPTDPTASTGGPSVVFNDTPIDTSDTPSPALNTNTTYYWEVHGRSASQYGDWSSIYSFATYTPLPAPTVSGIGPSLGPLAGGTVVTIIGSGLTGATEVEFGSNPAVNFAVASDTQVIATSPAGTAGTVDVTVTTAGGISAASPGDQFTYVVAPTVGAIRPSAGPVSGGTTVTITGSGLTGATEVDFGSHAVSNFTVDSDSQITATSPAEDAGTVHVTVTTAGGTSATSSADQFTYIAQPPFSMYTPAQIRTAYGIDSIKLGSLVGDGTGQTIAIVAAYDNPKLVSSTDPQFSSSDLHNFDVYFGLPDPPSFLKLDQNGGTNYPPLDPYPFNDPRKWGLWELEEAMDVEWAHAVAPQANIVLIEIDPKTSDLYAGVQTAASRPGVSVVSMSSGELESDIKKSGRSELTYDDSTFTTPSGHAGVTFVAASGDQGSGVLTPMGQYPAFSPNVVAVGGTSLYLSSSGDYYRETGWGWGILSYKLGGSGGGRSQYEKEPSYQTAVQRSGKREMPDVAFDADKATRVAVYDSYDNGPDNPWTQGAGTSLGAPCWAGLIATADQLRVSQGGTLLDGPTQTLPYLYQLGSSSFHDITSGNNGKYSARKGYDMVTGLGTPIANVLVPQLATMGLPSVTALSKAAGPVAGGMTVTIAGANLDNATKVLFSATPVTRFLRNTADQIVVVSPPGTVGTVDIRVVTACGTSPASSADQFTYVALPAVTGINPASGYVKGGTIVTITGTDLANATAVLFGKKAVTKFVTDDADHILVISPAGKLGTVDIRVVTAGGTSAITPKDKFTYSATRTITRSGLRLTFAHSGVGFTAPTLLDDGLITPDAADGAILSMLDDLDPIHKRTRV